MPQPCRLAPASPEIIEQLRRRCTLAGGAERLGRIAAYGSPCSSLVILRALAGEPIRAAARVALAAWLAEPMPDPPAAGVASTAPSHAADERAVA